MSDGTATVADGWYVDDVRIEEKDPQRLAFPFSDNFESGLGNWTVSGHDWDLTTTTARTVRHSLTDSPAGNYLPNSWCAATLAHPIDLSSTVAPVLQFWHQGTIGAYDGGYVQVSTDGGTTWGTLDVWSNWQQSGFTPNSPYAPGEGDPVQFDLQPYRTSSVQVRFLLVSGGGSAEGWYIDDVRIREITDVTGVVTDDGDRTPTAFALGQVRPNPFNPAATISFEVPQPARVRLEIFDAAGRRVRTLVDEERTAGRYDVRWDGTGDDGGGMASGVYICRMKAGSFREMRRMTLVR